jgi:hypothetical protein
MATRDFDRRFFTGENLLTRMGNGALGGKASGLAGISEMLSARFGEGAFPGLRVSIPRSAVIATNAFDAFMERNALWDVALSGATDDRIALAFQKAPLPAELVGDLRALASEAHTPLAVRSSSLLEDAAAHPFAGVYGTKMIPNNEMSPDARFHKLVEAVKFVWASTFSSDARRYLESVGRRPDEEKMAVLLQEIVGRRSGDRFYPLISAVARSYDFYPFGGARGEDGVVSLALGLGKTIVDGATVWSYSPARPTSPPPFNGIGDVMKNTQKSFYAVNMGKPPAYDPIREAEHLVRGSLFDAAADGTLPLVASTYDPQSDRLVPGVGRDGPRVIDFAPILDGGDVPFNEAVRALLAACAEALGQDVEIELAADVEQGHGAPMRLGFLQVRPMLVSREEVSLSDARFAGSDAVIASPVALGNGRRELADIVYLKPDSFYPKYSGVAALEIERVNAALVAEGRPYLLIGFGRWGTSDPWRGVPVTWSQISGARAIVEVERAGMETEHSQGSHFFHNLTGFQVLHISVSAKVGHRVSWEWLAAQPAVEESRFVRHVRPARPVDVVVDGRAHRGVVLRHGE